MANLTSESMKAGPPFSLRIAASFAVEPLLPGLKFWLDELGAADRLHVAPYGQVLQTLLDPASPFVERGGLNVVLLRVRDWLRELPAEKAADIDFVRSYVDKMARDVERAVRAHRARAAADTLLLFCPSYGGSSSAENIVLRHAEETLSAALRVVPGLQMAFAGEYHAAYRVDDDEVHDPVRDQLAHLPYRDRYYLTLATIVARQAFRRLAPRRKVIVVDCDNTLWGGVVGEVGAEGVAFDASHLALHETLNRLVRAGALVCLCSKNEEADVWPVFAGRGELALRPDDIVAATINWQAKSENLRSLAARLNLGLDSFIFIDDNPVECAEVRARCPEVLTLQWPTDPDRALQLLRHTWELDATDATTEDQRRTQMYREEFRRQELRNETLTFADFIGNLELNVDIAPLSPPDLRRAAQLTLRTNQFNFTTRRREESDLQALVAEGRHQIRTVRVQDRFGDYGLVGLVIAEPHDDVLLTDTFLLSCRVLGRGVEHRIAAELGRMAVDRGLHAVRLRVETTKRNTPARKFLETITPADLRREYDGGLECDIPASALAALRFEAVEQPGYVPAEAEGSDTQHVESADGSRVAPASSGDALRWREAQIARTAFELADAAALEAAITAAVDGEVTPGLSAIDSGMPPAGASDVTATRATAREIHSVADVAAVVSQAFSDALRIPARTVMNVDRLEALGCTSMKIVEITVALLERFPALPTTLLFEHRSVNQIVLEIARIAGVAGDAVYTAAGGPVGAAFPRPASTSLDIAVVGMHLRCAGANSPSELWDLLSAGQSGVRPVPQDRKYFLQPLDDSRPHWAGLLDEVARFDAEFFGISPREAEYMDPQLRLFLEVAWNALEDAGAAGTPLEQDTGVFVGVMYGDYGRWANVGGTGRESPYRCWEGFSLANRLSQIFGFHGPSFAVDTACSSSGTALHLACQALKAGDCRVAIVGGVNLILDPDRFGALGRLGILSPRGRCEAFGADADGTVLGEGAGVVVLRRVDEALERGDRIYGVIKGTGVSTGSGTVGFTAPNPQAQAQAIARSLETARIDPRTITYVETHGTGTSLGDPIEVRGLMLGYSNTHTQDPSLVLRHRCTIGSIKPNIGHLEAGAGVLGLIKVLLQFQRRTKLPSLTSPVPNPQIPFADTPFDVQRNLESWEPLVVDGDDGRVVIPRRASVSSFGVGGANAHVIIEEAPQRVHDSEAPPERPTHLLAASARTPGALRAHLAALAVALERDTESRLADICYSSNVGREAFDHRVAVTASSREELLDALARITDGRESPRVAAGVARSNGAPRIAFLFTGQGSQYAGMGARLYETQPVFRNALDVCAAIFARHASAVGSQGGVPDQPILTQLLFAREGTTHADLLNQTGYTQPALFAFEYALATLWRSWGITPGVVMGHSVGEIAAMCVAGGVSLEDGVKLIAARGRLMQALPPGGTMTSVMAAEPRVLEAIAGAEHSVAIAAVNAPSQVVISGAGVAVAEITARLEADGIRTKPLVVSHAFHSPLMKPMLAEYESVVRQIAFARPEIPFVSCVDGALVTDEVTQPEYWLRQVMDPVRFTSGMAALEQQHIDSFVEIGPHPVLLGMGRQCVTDSGDAYEWLPSLRKDADAWQTLLGSVARLYARGASIDWKAFDAPYVRHRVSVPAYVFSGRQYWLRDTGRALRTDDRGVAAHSGATRVAESTPVSSTGAVTSTASARQRGAQLYELTWERQPLAAAAQPASKASRYRWIIFADRRGVGDELAKTLAQAGARVAIVRAGVRFVAEGDSHYEINPERNDDFHRLWTAVAGGADVPLVVVHLWAIDFAAGDRVTTTSLAEAERVALGSAVHLVQAAAGAPQSKLWFITQDAVATERIAVAQAPLWGFGRTVALEHPAIWGGLLDLPAGDGARDALTGFVGEVLHGGLEDQIALRGTERYVARLTPCSTDAPASSVALDSNGTYLITGGVGALGWHAARWLVEKGARHLVLTSRRGDDGDATRHLVASLESDGASVCVVAADVTRSADLDAVLGEIARGGVPLRGVVHAAGIDRPVPVAELTPAELHEVLAPKVLGAWLLHDRTRHLNLDLFICFSSVASILGAQGRAHYAAANAFLDALMIERRRLHLPALGLNWGPWAGGGMANQEQLRQFERIGNFGLQPGDALAKLEQAFEQSASHLVIADIDWPAFRAAYEARRTHPIVSLLPRSVALGERAAATDTFETALAEEISGNQHTDADDWLERLGAVADADRQSVLETLLRTEVAHTLGFDGPDDVPLDKSFYRLGLDSLMMAELVGRLRKRVGTSCTALVFDHPNVQALAPRLLDTLSSGLAARAPRAHAGVALNTERGEVLEWAADHFPSEIPPTGLEGYSPAVEPEVFAFQREAWPHRRAATIADRWKWMFVHSARRLGIEPRVWLYRDAGRIVGHMGAIPIRLKLGDEVRTTPWLVDTMVLEQHRDEAVGSRLMLAAREDVPFALSLGQTPEMRQILLRLGWMQVAPLQTAQLLIRPEHVFQGKLPGPAAWAAGIGMRAMMRARGGRRQGRMLTSREIPRFDRSHDCLWAMMSRDLTCAVVRDSSFLNWKYVDQPDQTFVRLEVRDGARLRGIAVLMFREPDASYRYRRAFLVDVVAPLADAQLLHQVLAAAVAAAADRGADSLVCLHANRRLTQGLRSCGFLLREPTRFLLVQVEGLASELQERVTSGDSWFVTHGDSDIDRPGHAR